MIKFSCGSCEQTITVREDAAGKRIRCPKCGAPLVIPQDGDAPAVKSGPVDRPSAESLLSLADTLGARGRQDRGEQAGPVAAFSDLSKYEQGQTPLPDMYLAVAQQPGARKRAIPKPALVAGAGGVLLLILGLVCWFALRDTWETDHYGQILGMEKEARSASNDGRFAAAAEGYERLLSLVGERKIENPELAAAVHRAERGLEKAREDLKAQQGREYYLSNKGAILAAIEKADSARAAGQFEQAVRGYQEAIGVIRNAPYLSDELGELLKKVEAGRQAAKDAQTKPSGGPPKDSPKEPGTRGAISTTGPRDIR